VQSQQALGRSGDERRREKGKEREESLREARKAMRGAPRRERVATALVVGSSTLDLCG
jgi:hypothetical protein